MTKQYDRILGGVDLDCRTPRSGIRTVYPASPPPQPEPDIPGAITEQENPMTTSPTIAGMTQAEREAVIQRIASWQPPDESRSAPQWTPQDHFVGIAQAALLDKGLVREVPGKPLHPLAYRHMELDAQFRDTDAIREAAVAVFGEQVVADHNLDNPVAAARFVVLAASEISELFSVATQMAIDRSADSVLAKVKALTYPVTIRDFRQAEIADIYLPDFGAPHTGEEFLPYRRTNLTGRIEAAQVGTTDVQLVASHQSIVNNAAIDLFARGAIAFRNQAYRQELRAIATLLDANGNLSDGSAWFTSGDNNLLTSTGIDAAGLGAACSLLRDQGHSLAGDLDAVTLLCHADDEITARTLVYGLQGQPIRIIATSFLTGDQWYLLADPATAPAIARATLQGASDSVTFTGTQRAPDNSGLMIEAAHRAGFAALSRIGAVRCEV